MQALHLGLQNGGTVSPRLFYLVKPGNVQVYRAPVQRPTLNVNTSRLKSNQNCLAICKICVSEQTKKHNAEIRTGFLTSKGKAPIFISMTTQTAELSNLVCKDFNGKQHKNDHKLNQTSMQLKGRDILQKNKQKFNIDKSCVKFFKFMQ